MGGGDVKLAALIGLWVGFPHVLWALTLGILAGAVTTLVLLLSRRWSLTSHIPYAPFLCFGTVLSLLGVPFFFVLRI
jgi:leader peptidase (prepilin peptidase)/N-methyltransferase